MYKSRKNIISLKYNILVICGSYKCVPGVVLALPSKSHVVLCEKAFAEKNAIKNIQIIVFILAFDLIYEILYTF
jgi:hypothetical protein